MQSSQPAPAATGPSTPGATTPATTSLPPLPPKKSHTGALIGGAVVIIAVLAVVGLGVAGVIPIPGLHSSTGGGGGGGTGGAGTPSTFSSAWSQANTSASQYASGTWNTYVGAGLASPEGASLPFSTLSNESSAGCTFTILSGHGSSIQVAPVSPATSGLASVWIFLYGNGNINLLIMDNGVSATPIATLSGQCATEFNAGLIQPVSPSVLGSVQVAKAVYANASAFLSTYTNISATYSILGAITYSGYTVLPSEWQVTYTTCTINSPSSTGHQFNATLNPTTGAVLYSQVVSNASCSTPITPTPSPGLFGVATPTSALQAAATILDW